MRTLSLSRGAVHVRDTAPAPPPATRCRHHIPVFFSSAVNSSGTNKLSPTSKIWGGSRFQPGDTNARPHVLWYLKLAFSSFILKKKEILFTQELFKKNLCPYENVKTQLKNRLNKAERQLRSLEKGYIVNCRLHMTAGLLSLTHYTWNQFGLYKYRLAMKESSVTWQCDGLFDEY